MTTNHPARLIHGLALALCAALSLSAAAQSEWPEEYRQYGQPGGATAAPNIAPSALNPAFKPFECEAPLSNYHQRRDEAEVRACIDAHLPLLNALYGLYPGGIGYAGELKWSINVAPRGSVVFATAGGPGSPATSYVQIMSVLIRQIHFGNCPPCKSETVAYLTRTPR